MTKRQGSATPAPTGGQVNDRWPPLVVERIEEVPPVLAHDMIDAALAVHNAENSGGGSHKTVVALDRLTMVINRGVSLGVFRRTPDPTL